MFVHRRWLPGGAGMRVRRLHGMLSSVRLSDLDFSLNVVEALRRISEISLPLRSCW